MFWKHDRVCQLCESLKHVGVFVFLQLVQGLVWQNGKQLHRLHRVFLCLSHQWRCHVVFQEKDVRDYNREGYHIYGEYGYLAVVGHVLIHTLSYGQDSFYNQFLFARSLLLWLFQSKASNALLVQWTPLTRIVVLMGALA